MIAVDNDPEKDKQKGSWKQLELYTSNIFQKFIRIKKEILS